MAFPPQQLCSFLYHHTAHWHMHTRDSIYCRQNNKVQYKASDDIHHTPNPIQCLVSFRHRAAIEADSQVYDVVFLDGRVQSVSGESLLLSFIKDSCYCYLVDIYELLHMTGISCAVHHILVKMATQFHQTTMTDPHIHNGGDERTSNDK